MSFVENNSKDFGNGGGWGIEPMNKLVQTRRVHPAEMSYNPHSVEVKHHPPRFYDCNSTPADLKG